MSIVSYAQNFEDVMLWRALSQVKNGFYIDVGAQHPVIDSLSKAFYEKGWRGIHVEATPVYAELLRQDRPDETVLQVALAASNGMLSFYEVPETGLSTGDAEIALRHRERGLTVRELVVPCVTLADVFAKAGDRDVHWLKVDVEGMERAVLEGWGDSPCRPWLVVVESTLPNTQIETHEAWESLLLERGYSFVYFDGLNRFYVCETHAHFATTFRAGPNVFDGFALSGTAQTSFCSLINSRATRKHEEQVQEIARLEQEKAQYRKQREELEQKFSLRVRAVETENLRLSSALAADSSAHTRRERALADLAAKTSQKSRAAHEALLAALAQRERECGQQVLEIQKRAEQERIEQINELKRESAARESAWAAFEAQTNLGTQTLQRTIAERERHFSAQLSRVIDEATQERAELGRLYRQQESSLRGELAEKERIVEAKLLAAEMTAQQAERELAARSVELSEQLAAAQEKFAQDGLEIAHRFERLEAELIKQNTLRCEAIRDDLARAEREIAEMAERSEMRDAKHSREAVLHLDRIGKLQKLVVRSEERRLRKSASMFRKFSPTSINIAAVARIHNLVSLLDAEINESSGLQRIAMNSQVSAQINYQPTFEQNDQGIYGLDEFQSLYDRNFVRAAYLAILRREPDPDGERHYLKQVRAGVAKDEILDDILKSAEARNYKTSIRGLGAARVIRRACRIPVFGKLVFAILFLLDVTNHLQDLRALENHVIRIAEESQGRYQAEIGKNRAGKN
ncbi:FkbM family methyltransferase [Paraburkholderia phenazinium]|uniref:Methyltransferase, FkbM family n=1 Tax=Paraburkholderia phenazinium TaxID=60549 RepID=A0A1G8E187_9BURK|nr:FkbM family methyltransferase [Paraburkholderia phenazinium]SDH63654.1 methyltransferase, FkbM family [Paraburkholderia phenazinium]